MKTLSMAETKKILGGMEKTEKTEKTQAFLKKFNKVIEKKAGEMRKELAEIGSLKIKEEDISKVIDLLPEDTEDLNKIFIDVSLDENETNKLLEIVKKYK